MKNLQSTLQLTIHQGITEHPSHTHPPGIADSTNLLNQSQIMGLLSCVET